MTEEMKWNNTKYDIENENSPDVRNPSEYLSADRLACTSINSCNDVILFDIA
jgi:hypothetical protein